MSSIELKPLPGLEGEPRHEGSEGWERPDIWWWECRKRPEYEQLLSFPFKNTKCPDWIGQPVGS